MKNHLGRSAIVLLSGGQDSCTSLAWALENFDVVSALTIMYGQRHVREVDYARAFGKQLGVLTTVLSLDSVGRLLDSALTNLNHPVQATGGMGNLPSTFTPGRNLLFLTVAASAAASVGIEHVVIGCSQTDYSGYPDCRQVFIESFTSTFALALGENAKMTVHTPLMHKTKSETFGMAYRLGVLPYIIRDTLTCYMANETQHEWGRGCGECPACLLRKRGFEEWQNEVSVVLSL